MRRKPDGFDSGRLQNRVECLRVFAVAVVDEMRRGLKRSVEASDIPRLPRNPFRVRMRCRASHEAPACPDVEKEDIAGG